MSDGQTRLKVLLRSKHLQEHRAFSRAYERAARKLDPTFVPHPPSKATFYRWLSGDISRLPHPEHCRILEAMFPGTTASELFEQWDGSPPVLPSNAPEGDGASHAGLVAGPPMSHTSDLVAAFATRSEFMEHVPPHTLFDGASDIKVVGLSLNLICQHYGDQRLAKLLIRGAHLQALFLDPDGSAIKEREIEERLDPGALSGLTRLNMQMLQRLRRDLVDDVADRLEIRTYDSTVRFNLTIIDNAQCVAQPYLPALRGVDAPTFVLQKRPNIAGMFETFSHVFDALWSDARGAL